MRELQRKDIVSQSIKQVWQTPWKCKSEWFICETFVELENGVCFELVSQDALADPPPPIYQIELGKLEVIPAPLHVNGYKDGLPAQFGEGGGCNGETILEVIATEMWVSLGLLLSSNEFLAVTAYTDPIVGPRLYTVGDFYKIEDAVTYWGHQPLTHQHKV